MAIAYIWRSPCPYCPHYSCCATGGVPCCTRHDERNDDSLSPYIRTQMLGTIEFKFVDSTNTCWFDCYFMDYFDSQGDHDKTPLHKGAPGGIRIHNILIRSQCAWFITPIYMGDYDGLPPHMGVLNSILSIFSMFWCSICTRSAPDR